jgi:hypothetical protein
LVFTTAVVSPALKAIKWSEAERVGVRSVIGKRYARVGTINLALLLIFAVLDGLLNGFGATFYVEYVLLAVVFGLVAAHGAYFGRKITTLAEAERGSGSDGEARVFAQERRALQEISLQVSFLNVLVSAAIVILAVSVGK